MKRLALFIAVVIVGLYFVSAITSAQAPQSNDVNAALIHELHDLRLAIEKLATVNSRAQLLSVRASQQGQLISTLTTELIALNGKLADAQANTVTTTTALEQINDRLRIESEPKERTLLEAQRNALAADLNRKRIEQAAMQTQIEAIRQQILAEQRRLDEFDRAFEDLQK